MASIPDVSDVREYLEGFGISATDPSGAWINNRINNWAVPLVERLTNFSLSNQESKTDYFSGTGSKVLILDSKNIVSIDSVEYIGIDPDDPVSSSSAFEFVQSEGLIRSTGEPFPRGNKNIKVTYTIGFASGNLPDDLHELIVILVADKVLAQNSGKSGGGNFLYRL